MVETGMVVDGGRRRMIAATGEVHGMRCDGLRIYIQWRNSNLSAR